MKRPPSRRTVLRGTGVALALPWLESLAPREARGQEGRPRRSFVAMYFPCGVGKYWQPATPGAGDAWSLSEILQPLAPFKSHTTVLAGVGNYGPFGGHAEPAHSNLSGAYLTCRKPLNPFAGVAPTSGISVDQVIANGLGKQTPIHSLQLGLATILSSPDGLPAQFSRSISWAGPDKPLYKVIDPGTLFDQLVGTKTGAPLSPAPNKSVLDFVANHSASVRRTLGRTDQKNLDEFLASVRSLEKRAQEVTVTCMAPQPRPTGAIAVNAVPEGYSRDAHADIMIDLLVMALRCDLTRVATFMFEDSRSDYLHSFLTERAFGTSGMPSPPPVPAIPARSLYQYVNSGEASDGWATVHLWMLQKVARLCTALQTVRDANGTLLDSATIWLGSEMNGGPRDALRLPLLYVGSGGGRLKTNQFIDFANTTRKAERLANVYLTFIRSVFDLPDARFGDGNPLSSQGGTPANAFGAGTDVIPELLRT